MKVVAFVPIRLNSKRVEHKNLKLLGGKPLLCYVLDTLSHVRGIDEVYAYCSSPLIAPYCNGNVHFLQRPERLDGDDVLGRDIYNEFTKTIDADVYILAHTTSPFIKSATIENALEQVTAGGYDSAFSVEKFQTFAWYQGAPLNYELKNIPRTQTIEPLYVETSAFYIFRREVWTQLGQRIGNKPYMAVVDHVEGIDIDWPEDFSFAEKIMIQAQSN